MGKTYPVIDDALRKFIQDQHVFFVGSAPLGGDGHVNVSPKGLDTLCVLGQTTVAYLDLTGSGIETVAHVKENGRIVLMLCAFEGLPKVLRLYGRGRVVEPRQAEYSELLARFRRQEGARSIVLVELSKITLSCGYGVPLLKYEGERAELDAWAQRKGVEGLNAYREKNNGKSVDGLPGLEF